MARALKPSTRGELEITDLNNLYLQTGQLHLERLGLGVAWLDTGTCESLMQSGDFVETIETGKGLRFGCLEEIAYNQCWIDATILHQQVVALGKSAYGWYVGQILKYV